MDENHENSPHEISLSPIFWQQRRFITRIITSTLAIYPSLLNLIIPINPYFDIRDSFASMIIEKERERERKRIRNYEISKRNDSFFFHLHPFRFVKMHF